MSVAEFVQLLQKKKKIRIAESVNCTNLSFCHWLKVSEPTATPEIGTSFFTGKRNTMILQYITQNINMYYSQDT